MPTPRLTLTPTLKAVLGCFALFSLFLKIVLEQPKPIGTFINMETNEMPAARINAILNDASFNTLFAEGTMESSKRIYAFRFLKMIDSPKGSLTYKSWKKQLTKAREVLMNEHIRFITKIGIDARPNG